MSAVDVLAVMDEAATCFDNVEECPDDAAFIATFTEARSAVAELIEAAGDTLKAGDSNEIVGRDAHGHPLNIHGVRRHRLRAALARATGAQS